MAFCGIDVGTQGVRAVLVDADGTLLATGSADLPTGRRAAGRHEQDPADWWAALCAAVRACGPEKHDVRAVALDATSGTVLVEGADGAAIGPALMYDDARASDEAQVADRVGAALWSELGYRMQPSWALPKVMWLVAHGHVGARQRVVHQSDHLVRRLVGAPVATDTSSALKTGVDLRTASWSEGLLEELGVRADVLPQVVLPGTVLGSVGAQAAAATGLPAGLTVRAGMTDGCAAQIAAGAITPGSWSSALGTTLVVKGATTTLVRDPQGSVYSHRHPDGGWLPGGASSTGAGVLTTTFDHPGADRLRELTIAAAALVPVGDVTYPLAGNGERFPFVAPDAHGFGLPMRTDASDARTFAAICQGIAYVERLAYDALGELGADVSGTVAFTGATADNRWWNQLRADVLNRRAVVPSSPQAAVGMAVLAASETGELTATTQRMVGVRESYEPDPDRHAAFEAGYRSLVDALAERGWLTNAAARAAAS